MDDSERRTAKRSRFDQTEPEPKRASRFDRRSRSPPARRDEGRERSPLNKADSPAKRSPIDPAAAASAAAAKINAQLQARKGIQHVDVPPINSADSSAAKGSDKDEHPIRNEMYVADGDFIQDIEVNDLRNRYLLTKGSTQEMIRAETGADVTTRGNYYPNKSMATAANPPLYLHITSTTKAGLEAAVAKVNELIKQELPQLVDERRFRRRDQEQPVVERDEFGRRKWPEERISIPLEPIPGFNLRAQVVGHGGTYVKHIQQETGCRVQIKGRGSGYLEAATNRESDKEMFLHVTGPDANMVAMAKDLCEDLIANVKEQYEEFKARPPRFSGPSGGYGEHGGRGSHHHNSHGGSHHGGPHHGSSHHGPPHHHGRSYDGPHGGSHGGPQGGPQGGPYDGGHGGGHGGSHHGGHRGGSHGGSHHNSHSPYSRYGSEHASSNSPAPSGANTPASTAAAATATSDYAAQYAQYYGGADPYAAWGGYANYVALYQQYYGGQGQTPAPSTHPAAPGQTPSSAPPPPPPPPSDAAPPPPPPPSSAPPPPPPPPPPSGPAPPGAGSYSAVPPPPGL